MDTPDELGTNLDGVATNTNNKAFAYLQISLRDFKDAGDLGSPKLPLSARNIINNGTAVVVITNSKQLLQLDYNATQRDNKLLPLLLLLSGATQRHYVQLLNHRRH